MTSASIRIANGIAGKVVEALIVIVPSPESTVWLSAREVAGIAPIKLVPDELKPPSTSEGWLELVLFVATKVFTMVAVPCDRMPPTPLDEFMAMVELRILRFEAVSE